MAYTFTITEVIDNIGLTVSPAANFTITDQVNSLSLAETRPQFTVTEPPDNSITIDDDGYIMTLTNVDQVFTLTNGSEFVVTATNVVQSITLTQDTNLFNFSATNVTFTSTTAISQIQTENMATIFKGEFTSTDAVIYYRGHIVRYNQNIYVATVEPGGRVTNPAAPPGNPQWTLVFSQTGLTGWQVDAMEKAYNLGPWVAQATYTLNSFVHHQGYIWTLINFGGSYNSEPSRSNTNWLQIGGQGDQPLFTTSSVTFNSLTLNGNLVAAGGLFSNLTVTNRLTAGGIRYPITNGNLGQVLTTNGENEANWTDVNSLVTATIRPATRENLGGVIVGTGLAVTPSGVLSVSTGSVLIGWNLTDNLRTNGYSIETGVPPVVSEAFPVPQLEIGSGLRDSMDAALIFDARSTTASVVRLIGDTIRIGSGNASLTARNTLTNEIRISNTQTLLLGTVNIAGDTVLIGSTASNITLGHTATNISQNIKISSALVGGRVSSGGTYFDVVGNVKIAGKLLGGSDTQPVFAPAGIRFDDGTIITSGNANIPFATTTSSGVVIVGNGLNVTNGIITLGMATPTQRGGIRLGAGLSTAGDIVGVAYASTTTVGGIIVGAGLAITAGVLAVTTTSEFIIPPADDNTIGGVKLSTTNDSVLARATGIYIDGSGFATLRRADSVGFGGVKLQPGAGIGITGLGALELIKATTSQLGGVRPDGVTTFVDGNGILSAVGGSGTGTNVIAGPGVSINTVTNVITLTTATTSTIGGVVIGAGLEVVDGRTKVKIAGNNLFIDVNGALNTVSTSTVGQFDLSAESYTNGIDIRHSAGSQSQFQLNNNSLFLQLASFNGQSMRMFGGQTKLQYNEDTALILASSGVALSHNFHTKLTLATNSIGLQANSDAYALTLTDIDATITNLEDPNAAKLVLTTNETILRNNVVIKMQAPDTQFGSLFNSRIYAGAIYNFSGTGPPLLAEGVQYADLTVQRTAWPGYDYGQIVNGPSFGHTPSMDFSSRSLAVDFNL